jgi:hypothetical protein
MTGDRMTCSFFGGPKDGASESITMTVADKFVLLAGDERRRATAGMADDEVLATPRKVFDVYTMDPAIPGLLRFAGQELV